MTSRPIRRLAALACVAALAAVSCGGDGDTDADAPAATTQDPSDPASDAPSESNASDPTVAPSQEAGTEADAGTGVVPAALQFSAPLVGGGEIVGDELAGKPTAFWFWSPT